MGNIFDRLQKTVFRTVAQTFGYTATWEREDAEHLTAEVLYKDPTEAEGLSDVDFNPANCVMEYNAGSFEGLKAAVDEGLTEIVSIVVEGVTLRFEVARVKRKFDGRNYVAELTPYEL